METEHNKSTEQKAPSSTEGGRVDRIADQTRGLIDDIKEWIDLKVELVQLELEERFESLANHILGTLLVVVLVFITVLFALIVGALAIGNWLGDPLWGFLVVTGALALITVIVHLSNPRFVKAPWKGTAKKLPAAKGSDTVRLPQVAESAKKEHKNGRSTETK